MNEAWEEVANSYDENVRDICAAAFMAGFCRANGDLTIKVRKMLRTKLPKLVPMLREFPTALDEVLDDFCKTLE